jgi:hypothetical protein
MAAWRWCGGPSTRKMDVLIFCGKEKKTSENSFSLVKYNKYPFVSLLKVLNICDVL